MANYVKKVKTSSRVLPKKEGKKYQIRKLEIWVKNSSGSPRIPAGFQAIGSPHSCEKMKVTEASRGPRRRKSSGRLSARTARPRGCSPERCHWHRPPGVGLRQRRFTVSTSRPSSTETTHRNYRMRAAGPGSCFLSYPLASVQCRKNK